MSEDQPTGDHYATLGVMPRCEDVVIRAAYLALMHRYHPDKSGSLASSGRAQAIIAAYAVLGDPEKRMRYDWDRRRAAEELAPPPPPRSLLKRMSRGLIAAAVMLALIVPLLLLGFPGDPRVSPPDEQRDLLAISSPASAAPAAEPEPIDRTLAETAQPALPEPDEAADTDPLETPVALAPHRLKTASLAPAPAPRATRPREQPQARMTALANKPATKASTTCLSVRSGADKALCSDENLAALDQLGEVYYSQSWRVGDAGKRAALIVSRNGLEGRRDACRSDSCLRNAYLTYMREISAIVERQPSPPR